MVIHFVSLREIAELEKIFEYMTPDGWVIPCWLVLLRANAKRK